MLTFLPVSLWQLLKMACKCVLHFSVGEENFYALENEKPVLDKTFSVLDCFVSVLDKKILVLDEK